MTEGSSKSPLVEPEAGPRRLWPKVLVVLLVVPSILFARLKLRRDNQSTRPERVGFSEGGSDQTQEFSLGFVGPLTVALIEPEPHNNHPPTGNYEQLVVVVP